MSASIVIQLPTRKKRSVQVEQTDKIYMVTPGDVITEDTDYMRGHGNSKFFCWYELNNNCLLLCYRYAYLH